MTTNKNYIIIRLTLILFLLLPCLNINAQIISKTIEKVFSPSNDTSSWELITLKKLNCSIKMPGKPVFDFEEIESYDGQSAKFYTVSWESSILENLSFEFYVSNNLDASIHSDSMDQATLQTFYEEDISNAIGILSDTNLEFKKITIGGYPALKSETTFMNILKVEFAAVLIKDKFHQFTVYSDIDGNSNSNFYFDSFQLLKK